LTINSQDTIIINETVNTLGCFNPTLQDVEANPQQLFFILTPFHSTFFVSQNAAHVLVELCKNVFEDHVLSLVLFMAVVSSSVQPT